MLENGRDLASLDENAVYVDRQFLLFQLDFRGTALNSLTIPKQMLPTLKARGAQTTGLRFIDPVDYDDPSSKLYWRNVTKPSYGQDFATAFQDYKTKLFDAIASGDLDLRDDPTTQLPFFNITELIGGVENYNVKLEGLDNQITFNINNPETLANRRIGEAFKTSQDLDPEKTKQLFDVFAQLHPGENDVLVIKTFYGNKNELTRNGQDQKIRYFTEFMGFLTPLKQIKSQGKVERYTTTAYGTSKLFYTSMTVEQQALNQKQFLAGVELNNPAAPSVYSTQFNGKNTRQIFEYLMGQTLGLVNVDNPMPQYTNSGDLRPYWINDELFTNQAQTGFQNSLFVLLTLYLMDQTMLTELATPLLTQLFPANVDTNEVRVLDTPVRAILEHGDHQTFNKMAVTAFENFFSQLTYPAKILDEVRAATYYDVFESREGIIIARPPRYDKIEITDSELKRYGLETDQTKILVMKADGSGYEFARTADFYIKNEDLAADLSFEKNDMELETRVDAKFTWPFVGEQDFPAGHYTDGDLLIKYGLRTKGPVSNPNVQSPLLGTMFSPIALALTNAMTRKVEIAVKDYKPFRIGKLYYIEALGFVGYLVQNGIGYVNGALSKASLSLAMVRSVVDRPIADILKNDYELLNFGLCYLSDPVISRETKAAKAAKTELISRARQVLEDLSAIGGTNLTVPMFKYLPTIMDLIVEVEVDPGKSERQQSTVPQSITENQEQKTNFFTDAAVVDDICCTTSFGPSGVLNDDGIVLGSQAIYVLQEAGKIYVTNKTKVDNSVIPPAGILHYLVLGSGNQPITSLIFKDRVTHKALGAVKTPFASALLSQTPRNFKMSQVLVNKLAALDFALKYNRYLLAPELDYDFLPMNLSGFPQLYFMGGQGGLDQSVKLFGTQIPPQDYLNQLVAYDAITLAQSPGARVPSQNLFTIPNALKLDSGLGQFSNDFFQLVHESENKTSFRLPYGHFIYVNTDGGVSVLRAQGKYLVVENGSGVFRITPNGPGATLTPEDGSETSSSDYRDAFTKGNLYYISPYTDMTPERMVQVSFDNSLIGFRTNANTGKVFALATESFRNSENDGHTKGNAVDLCPDYVVGSSESNLRLLPAFYTRWEAFLKTYFQRTVDPQGHIPLRIIKNAITIQPVVSGDASASLPSFSAPIYHCEVLSSENDRYTKAIRYYGEA